MNKINDNLNEEYVNPFTKYKIITYLFNIICPLYALYRIWRDKSEFEYIEKLAQTMLCVTYMFFLIKPNPR